MIAFVKDVGNNLGTVDGTLLSMIDYELLKFLQVCKGTCFGCVTFKACQYAKNDHKVFMGLTLVCVKDVQNGLKKQYLNEKIKEREAKMGKCLN